MPINCKFFEMYKREPEEARNPDKTQWKQLKQGCRTVVFFVNFGSEIEIGNQQVWGKNLSIMNLAKKKGKKRPKFQVYGMMDRKGDEILSTTLRLCPSLLELVWTSPFLSITPKIGKLWNLFSPISLDNSHFFRFSLVSLAK